MTTYAVINRATGAEVYRYQHTEAVPWQGMGFDEFDHVALPDEPPPDAPPSPEPVRLTKLEFRDRFTVQEKVGIEFASLDAPAAPLEDRLRSAQLRVFMDDIANATPDPDGRAINLGDPRTIAAVQMLEGAGLIAPGRAAEILGGA
jgi:hypothetical protein